MASIFALRVLRSRARMRGRARPASPSAGRGTPRWSRRGAEHATSQSCPGSAAGATRGLLAPLGEEVYADHCRFSLSHRRLRPERHDELRRHRAQLRLVHVLRVHGEVHHRVEELHRDARALLDGLHERREVRAAARDVDAPDLLLAARREVEVERALDLAGEPLARLVDDLGDLLRDDLRRRRRRACRPRPARRSTRAPCGSPR